MSRAHQRHVSGTRLVVVALLGVGVVTASARDAAAQGPAPPSAAVAHGLSRAIERAAAEIGGKARIAGSTGLVPQGTGALEPWSAAPERRARQRVAFASHGRPAVRRVIGGVLGAVGGFFLGGVIGATIEGDRCACDDPGLQGVIIGAPIGAIAGGIAGVLIASR